MKAIPALALFALFALLAFAAACSRGPEEGSSLALYQHPPVGVLRAADYEVTLHAGPEGPLYTIRGEDGAELAREVSRQDLAAEFPRLHEELGELWAGNEQHATPPSSGSSSHPVSPVAPGLLPTGVPPAR